MSEIKDNFSEQAADYAAFRPGYPSQLLDFIYKQVTCFDAAWDCATGNGQAAIKLAECFKKVDATDISMKQLEHAVHRPNINYSVARAEKTLFTDKSFDLITVAQALHWFDFESFYKEVKRVAKPEALFAAWAYTLLRIEPDLDKIVDDFYFNITGPYWDKERKLVDEAYQTIPFPFEEIKSPVFYYSAKWELRQLVGYLNSWSAVQHFIRQKGYNPVEQIITDLNILWQEGERKNVVFPINLRMGKVK